MKELSIEEKARAYDEAIERAKECHNDGLSLHQPVKDVLEHIFPELIESEGERIRKELLAWLKSTDGQTLPMDRYNAAIAWLEKQSESMGISKDTKQKLETNLNKALEKETSESWNKFLDEQGEQKPAAKYKVGDTIYYDSFGRLVSFVIANIVEDGTDNPMYEDKNGNSVFQNDIVKQKPAEWSEEDEMFVHGLIRGLAAKRDIHGHTTFSSDCIDITETINWLKSLKERYTWKPSDEQIYWLKWATCRMPDTEKANEAEAVLEDLLEQLKKLREE